MGKTKLNTWRRSALDHLRFGKGKEAAEVFQHLSVDIVILDYDDRTGPCLQ